MGLNLYIVVLFVITSICLFLSYIVFYNDNNLSEVFSNSTDLKTVLVDSISKRLGWFAPKSSYFN